MKTPIKLVTKTPSTAYRRIFEGLRSQIMTGQFAPGTQLPPTKELAATWGSSPFTIHFALRKLALEGWIDRRHGAGTYIADPKTRFLCAGIYHDLDLGSTDQTSFSRTIHFALLRQFHRMGKETQVFTDYRPKSDQKTILPSLAEAIAERRIQCLVVVSINGQNEEALTHLTLPNAFLGGHLSSNRISYDVSDFFRESGRRLADQGCRSVGLITNFSISDKGLDPLFLQAIREAGLTTRDEWMRKPSHPIREEEFPKHGYHEFENLWRLPEKPDAVIVYPDMIASGVAVGVLEAGVRQVAPKMKFVFHRNASTKFLCPFPVTWGISDENSWAEGLIGIIEKQFAGEKVSPVFLPWRFIDEQVET